jgi:hypothetical protein
MLHVIKIIDFLYFIPSLVVTLKIWAVTIYAKPIEA